MVAIVDQPQVKYALDIADISIMLREEITVYIPYKIYIVNIGP